MIGPKVVNVYVHEQFMIIKNVRVVHCIDIFPNIEVSLVCLIIPCFLDFEQIIIDETNTTWQLLQLCTQGNSFLGRWPLDFIYKCIFNAWCNEICIVTQIIFWSIPHEGTIHTSWHCHASCIQWSLRNIDPTSTLMTCSKQLEHTLT
jgi:hypothetical protein